MFIAHKLFFKVAFTISFNFYTPGESLSRLFELILIKLKLYKRIGEKS